jgi:hypothetical protein
LVPDRILIDGRPDRTAGPILDYTAPRRTHPARRRRRVLLRSGKRRNQLLHPGFRENAGQFRSEPASRIPLPMNLNSSVDPVGNKERIEKLEPVDDLRPAVAVLSVSSAVESVKAFAFLSPAKR